MALAMHCNLPDIAPVVLSFSYEPHNALAYTFNCSRKSPNFAFSLTFWKSAILNLTECVGLLTIPPPPGPTGPPCTKLHSIFQSLYHSAGDSSISLNFDTIWSRQSQWMQRRWFDNIMGRTGLLKTRLLQGLASVGMLRSTVAGRRQCGDSDDMTMAADTLQVFKS